MNIVYLVRNDNDCQLSVTLTREDTGLVINLTSATVRLKVKRKGTSIVQYTITALNFSDFANGQAVFSFSSANLTLPAGQYIGEIEISYTSGGIETVFEEIPIVLRDDY
jgi:Fe-S cluster assembly iron-binding protein IscA